MMPLKDVFREGGETCDDPASQETCLMSPLVFVGGVYQKSEVNTLITAYTMLL